MTNILVTGGAGFIGSNFIPYFLEQHKDIQIINLDVLTYAGNLKNLHIVESHPRYKFIKGNICDRTLVENVFSEFDIQGVVHFAAESHVDNSIEDPGTFIETNVNGTFTLLDVAYRYWMHSPFQYKINYKNCRFHQISTDEVYGTLGKDGLFSEDTAYAPNSPYSASKASADMIVRSYNHTYGLHTVITNCSNNYGPKQHSEKLIPTIIRNALSGKMIPIYGNGSNIRDWLYVMDHCKGVDLAFFYGKSGEIYNIGGGNEKTNLEIAYAVCNQLDEMYPITLNKNIQSKKMTSYKELISFVEDRPGHDQRYAIDARKISVELGWYVEESFEAGLTKTIEWYLKKLLT